VLSGHLHLYVLHHPDKPEISASPPARPRIDSPVRIWKGALKPAALLHSLFTGRNRATAEDEQTKYPQECLSPI
jgi:hypothetical protein